MSFAAARLKNFAKGVLRQAGLELHRVGYLNSERTVLEHLLAAERIDTILDVGANTGQYAALVRASGYAGRIVSFEALPSVHARLLAAAAGDTRWTIAPCAALGSATGQIDIHEAGNSVSSSVLPMQQAHVDAAPQSAYIGSQRVPLERLDRLTQALPPPTEALLLKIDTQGYEREVLLGSTTILPRVRVLQVELSLVELYTGSPGFTPMLTLIEQLGFELFSLVPGLRNRQTGRLLQADGFFVRGGKIPGAPT